MIRDPELAMARSIARHGIGHGWPDEDVEAEIEEKLHFSPSDAAYVTLDVRREEQEMDIQNVHDEIAYDAISRTYQEDC
jgi:hypothetical protein